MSKVRSASVLFLQLTSALAFHRPLHSLSSFSHSSLRMMSSSSSSPAVEPIPRVLSIQSHTVHGFVGNKAATFPLQCMGFDVDCINTVSLSNHPAYHHRCRGESLSPETYAQLVDGLEENALLDYDVVLTGYTRSQAHLDTTVRAVNKIRAANPRALYVCDPVLGDNGEYYVPAELMQEYREKLLPLATAITPNLFECEVLSGVKIRSLSDAVRACAALHELGPQVVVMTGLDIAQQMPTPHLAALLSVKTRTHTGTDTDIDGKESAESTHRVYRVDIPLIDRLFAGCGDLFAAFSVAGLHWLRDRFPSEPSVLGEVLEISAQGMADVLSLTREARSRELCIVQGRDVYVQAQRRFQEVAQRDASSLSLTSSKLDDDAIIAERVKEEERLAPVLSPVPNPQNAYLAHHRAVTGVVFDMDGTLTSPGAIDFAAMYTRSGLVKKSPQDDILSLVQQLPTDAEKERALQIIYEEEMRGCERTSLRPGLHALIHSLQRAKVRLALCTRNCEDAYLHFLDKTSFEKTLFSPALWRDALQGLNKPDPALAQHIMEQWDVLRPETTWFVGDSLDDMQCGKRAGCTTVLISTTHNGALRDEHPEMIDHVVHSLEELAELLNAALKTN